MRPGVSLEAVNADVARMIRIELEKLPPPDAAEAAPADADAGTATKEPVLNNTAADPKGNGEAAPQD